HGCNYPNSIGRIHAHKWLVGMFGIDPVPTLSNFEIWRPQERPYIPENEFVNFGLVEYIDGMAVLVRIPKSQLAAGSLRNQTMNDIMVVLGCFICNSQLQSFQCLADGKRAIEPERQSGCQRRTKLPPAGLRPCPHHLQLTSIDAAFGEQ